MPVEHLDSTFCASALKALADPGRLRIIQALQSGAMAVSDLAESLEMEIKLVSHHLKMLRRSGLVTAERDGKFVYYELAPNLLERSSGKAKHLNLGCCRLEFPASKS